MRSIVLPDAALREAHAYIGGGGPDLAAVVAETRVASAKGSVEWTGTLTPETVHGLGVLHAIALEEGVRLKLEPRGLNDREQAYFEDYYAHGPLAVRRSPLLDPALVAGIKEALFAFSQMFRRVRPDVGLKGGKAVIIGAYGGDHVGDTGILGGVLLYLAKQFGTSEAEVLSHRPAHTARLVGGLASPFPVQVFDYDPRTISARLENARLLVIAGGPMMDFPRVLAKHLGTIRIARSKGIPLHIERVGVGPFKRRISRWAARRIFQLASSLSLRSSGDGRDPVLKGLTFSVGRDPAFDYLVTRTVLDRATSASETADRLLAGTDDHLLVGINLRPIRHELDKAGASHSKSIDLAFFEHLADAMIAVAAKSARPVTYVFYPMNPIEFGLSDLAAAYRLHRLVGGKVDFRVWEADPDIDDVLHLLRRMDAVVAMRFHAAIFALSQNKPTFGVDYCPSLKVEQLFVDLGMGGDVVQIGNFTAEWLTQRLTTLVETSRTMELIK